MQARGTFWVCVVVHRVLQRVLQCIVCCSVCCSVSCCSVSCVAACVAVYRVAVYRVLQLVLQCIVECYTIRRQCMYATECMHATGGPIDSRWKYRNPTIVRLQYFHRESNRLPLQSWWYIVIWCMAIAHHNRYEPAFRRGARTRISQHPI